MKGLLTTLLAIMLIMLVASLACGQTSNVEFRWTQPDSSMGTLMPDETYCCKRAIPDGDIAKYEIFIATPADTMYWGFVDAPTVIAEDATAIVPFEMLVPSSIAVRAVDVRGRTGPMSSWSDVFTVDPGEPGAGGKPYPIRVYFGG